MILYIALPTTPVTPITNNVILRTFHVPPKLANTKIAIIISIPTIEPICLFLSGSISIPLFHETIYLFLIPFDNYCITIIYNCNTEIKYFLGIIKNTKLVVKLTWYYVLSSKLLLLTLFLIVRVHENIHKDNKGYTFNYIPKYCSKA